MNRSLLLVVSMLCASSALAEPPALPANADGVTALVDAQLVAPLQKAEGKRRKFSRAMPVPIARRVRVLPETAATDARGLAYVRFAIDTRRAWEKEEGAWERDQLVGCAYPGAHEVYVKSDDAGYVPAKRMLGRSEARAPKGVCSPAADGATLADAR